MFVDEYLIASYEEEVNFERTYRIGQKLFLNLMVHWKKTVAM